MLPNISERIAKTLVTSAEQNFKTKSSNNIFGEMKNLQFLKEYNTAYIKHKQICDKWRKAGRPADKYHPAKIAKTESQRELQSISRYEESSKAIHFQNELIDSFSKDLNSVYSKLKYYRGIQNGGMKNHSLTLCVGSLLVLMYWKVSGRTQKCCVLNGTKI